MRISDWSSDVCSSDLRRAPRPGQADRSWSRTHGRRRCARIRPHSARHAEAPASDRRSIPAHSRSVPRPVPICPFRSEEHTSELQSLMRISYAVFCLKKKKKSTYNTQINSKANKTKRIKINNVTRENRT